MKRILIALTTVAAMAIMLTSCAESDITLSKDLDGTWNVSTWTAGGVELLGVDIFGLKIESASFNFENEGEGMGKVTRTMVLDAGGFPLSIPEAGTYQTTSGDVDLLIMTFPDDSIPTTITATMVLDKKEFRLEYTEDGEMNIVAATKE